MATETQTPTETRTCPTCGARIARPDLSLCSYCATPLGLEKKSAEEIEEKRKLTMERLAKMAAHEDYPVAFSWTPPEPVAVRVAHSVRRWAITMVVVGAGIGLIAKDLGTFPRILLGILALALVIQGVARILGSTRVISASTKYPLVKRPVLVADRRSETEQHGMHGMTVYFYTFEFEDGNVGEFRWPGTGPAEDPLAIKTTGLAYTRGAELLAFRPIRV